jgi:hypothetical protein
LLIPALVECFDEFVDALAEVGPAIDVSRYYQPRAEQFSGGCGAGRGQCQPQRRQRLDG